jgi:hypothetical protein
LAESVVIKIGTPAFKPRPCDAIIGQEFFKPIKPEGPVLEYVIAGIDIGD